MNLLNLYVALLYGFWIQANLDYRNTALFLIEASTTDDSSESTSDSSSDTPSDTFTESNSDTSTNTDTSESSDSSTGSSSLSISTQNQFYTSTLINVCDNFCKWPWPNYLGDVTNCACPAGSFNIDNNCCLSQDWIIGLGVGFGGFVILSLSSIIAYLCCCPKFGETSEDKLILKDAEEYMDSVNLDDSLHSRRSAREVTEAGTEITEVDPGGVRQEEVHVAVVEVTHPVASSDQHPVASSEQPYQVLISEAALVQSVPTTPAQNGNVVIRTNSETRPPQQQQQQQQQQQLQRPLSYEEHYSNLYKDFVPQLDNVDTDKDYCIRRPVFNDKL